MTQLIRMSVSAPLLILVVTAAGQTTVWSTIACGGGPTSAGTLEVFGVIGQPDTGTSSAAGIECRAGFLGVGLSSCYPNCDGSTAAPILNVNDFQCFINRFAATDVWANCDGSTAVPVLNVNDFQCFLNSFAAGCS